MASVYKEVQPFEGSDLRYGFRTNVDPSVSIELGQINIDTANPINLVIGATRPKPRKATRLKGNNFVSSFVAATSIASARVLGYSIGKSRGFGQRGANSTRAQTYYLEINGIKYAWNLTTKQVDFFGATLIGLGITPADSNDDDLVFGANYPKPPSVSRTVGIQTRSTFCDPVRIDSLPVGFALVDGGRYENEDIPR